MNGIIYVLTNPVMTDLVKIGKTTNLEERVRHLSSHSGVPVAFEIYYACKVADADKAEKLVHEAFEIHRVNPKREFFRMNPDRAVSALKLAEVEDITPGNDYVEDQDEQRSLNRERNRRSFFKFSSVQIPPGSELHFSHDANYIATVSDDRNVEFEGEITSLSQASVKLLNRIHNKSLTSARGPDYWIFEDETLTERRIRLENEDS